MENEFKRIIEINGVKVEIDLREARRVDTFKVGDKVKLLKKTYSNYESHFATIIGFDEFKVLPTMVVAYLTYDDIKFEYINAESKDVEICPIIKDELIESKVGDLMARLDLSIQKKKDETEELMRKKEYLVNNIGKLFK